MCVVKTGTQKFYAMSCGFIFLYDYEYMYLRRHTPVYVHPCYANLCVVNEDFEDKELLEPKIKITKEIYSSDFTLAGR